ncbi:MAG: FtsX-like permease family protein [Acidipila sp.]|nr:FtsX-like permease family protein [Acidipila sp.]
MLRSETLIVALDALRANKVKAFLTMLGVVIGSACIVLVVTVALTGKNYILSVIEGVGSNLVYAQALRSGPPQTAVLADEITVGDLEAVREGIPQIKEAGASRDLSLSVIVDGVERAVTVVGITSGFQQIRNLVVVRGRLLDDDDLAARSKVTAITEELAAHAFPHDDPIGQTLRVGELRFTVVGVFRERVATFGQSEIEAESALIPLGLLKYYTGNDYLRVLYAQARRPEDVASVTRQVTEVLRTRHRPEATYTVKNLTALLDAARLISLVLSIILVIVAAIALVISGVGIMNIMLVTVTERTREIGVRMAIGAPRGEIRWQFLIEALIISGTGAIVGILIAVSIPLLVKPWLPGSISISVSWVSILLAFGVTCLSGVLFGYLPANRAAKLQPTESLRYE